MIIKVDNNNIDILVEFARQLINFAEAWGREHGCTELASDCELDNKSSINFHSGAGFVETNRIVCFKKNIKNDYNFDKK